jgi:sugar phosphate isomerase/epimerase
MHTTFSGSLLWQYFHPWPQRPAGLVEEGFAELAKRWLPILNEFDQNGVDLCYEIHPGEDLFDGETYEMFFKRLIIILVLVFYMIPPTLCYNN